MKKHWIMYLLIPVIGLSTGCKDLKKMIQGTLPFQKPKKVEEKPLIEYIESAELAQLILKPERKPLKISRDPFKPLITKDAAVMGEFDNKIIPTAQEQALEDVVLVGVAKLGDEFRVYLKTGSKTGVFKVQDKVRGFTIEQIDIDRVILKSGDHEIVKKRGKK